MPDPVIEDADLDDPELVAFLEAHLADLAPTAPAESRHALDLDGLRRAGVRVWVARLDGRVVGTAALSEIAGEPGHVELKSMRTDPSVRRRGIAGRLVQHVLDEAVRRGATRISLETGSMEFFAPARSLYRSHGFVDTGPFAAYRPDPNSVFLTRPLAP